MEERLRERQDMVEERLTKTIERAEARLQYSSS